MLFCMLNKDTNIFKYFPHIKFASEEEASTNAFAIRSVGKTTASRPFNLLCCRKLLADLALGIFSMYKTHKYIKWLFMYINTGVRTLTTRQCSSFSYAQYRNVHVQRPPIYDNSYCLTVVRASYTLKCMLFVVVQS